MSVEKLIRLARLHRSGDFTGNPSIESLSEAANTIRDEMRAASEFELANYLRQKELAPWVAFYVLEDPNRHPALKDEAVMYLRKLETGNSIESHAAKMKLKEIDCSE